MALVTGSIWCCAFKGRCGVMHLSEDGPLESVGVWECMDLHRVAGIAWLQAPRSFAQSWV